jgi:exonuclease SbcC
MDPIRLQLHNFTAYGDAEIQLDRLHLAALVGQNGAGKSSILDALTFALFGESTKGSSRSLDNHVRKGQTECRVTLDFRIGEDTYRVLRHRTLGKKSSLELFRLYSAEWVALSAKTISETQEQIEQLIRMDYKTFTATSLILQGQSDSLTSDMTDQERKEVLARILGLDMWDRIQEAAKRHAKSQRDELLVTQRQLQVAKDKATTGTEYRACIAFTEAELESAGKLVSDHSAKISGFETKLAQRDLLKQQLVECGTRLVSLRADSDRVKQDESEQAQAITVATELLGRPEVIRAQIPALETTVESATSKTESATKEVAEAESRFRDAEKLAAQLADLDQQITAREADLAQVVTDGARIRTQLDQQSSIVNRSDAIRNASVKATAFKDELGRLDALASTHSEIQVRCHATEREEAVWDREQTGETSRLQAEIGALKRQVDPLGQVPCGDDLRPICPLLSGAMDAQSRLETLNSQLSDLTAKVNPHSGELKDLIEERDALGYDQARHGQMRRDLADVASDANQLPLLESAETRVKELTAQREQMAARYRTLDAEVKGLHEKRQGLVDQGGSLGKLTQRLIAAKDALLSAQTEERSARDSLASLRQSLVEAERLAADAQTRIPELERKVSDLRRRQSEVTAEIERVSESRTTLETALGALIAVQTELDGIKGELVKAQGIEAGLRESLGRLRQSLADAELADQQAQDFQMAVAKLERRILVYEILDRACGKKAGVPALIVEAAVPQIEATTNDLLDRMAGGRLAIRLDTQAETRAGTLSEVLRIIILDGGEERPYQTFSGAERFMVDLSLRIALSKFLSHRAGAQISFLALDEGIACADQVNRHVIMDSVREVSAHFLRVLLVSHLQEVQESIPQRIEIARGPNGSTAKVVA